MTVSELFLLAVGLSADAFAAAICKGLSAKKADLKSALTTGAWFGLFQALMPLIGYVLGSQFRKYIVSIDHWIAFFLLSYIGLNMIFECRKPELHTDAASSKSMLITALATSIDALAVGITFAFLKVDIVPAVMFIGFVTFALSSSGLFIGHAFGSKHKTAAEFSGGAILIILGIKILFEHLKT